MADSGGGRGVGGAQAAKAAEKAAKKAKADAKAAAAKAKEAAAKEGTAADSKKAKYKQEAEAKRVRPPSPLVPRGPGPWAASRRAGGGQHGG